jgi:outer membrane protein TolC
MKPYELPETVTPGDDIQDLNVNADLIPKLYDLLIAAGKNNPELAMFDFKLDVLAVEKKLKFQELLPGIQFRYNRLAPGYDFFKSTQGPLFENNFQYGLSLSVPLRFSQGRGEYKKAKLKITETKLQQDLKRLMVQNKVKQYFNDLVTLRKQVALQEETYHNYLLLQRGEETRFSAGESNLFLVNARENKALEAQQKVIELKVKYFKTQLSLKWAAGLLI